MGELGIVSNLALAMVVTSLLAIEVTRLRTAAWAYLAQALLLVAIFASIAVVTHNELLYLWALVALITKATLIPYVLFAYIRRTGVVEERRPLIAFAPSVLLACLVMVTFYHVVHAHVEFLAPTAEAQIEPYRTNLAVALTIFTLGLYGMVSRRDAIKTIVSLCLLENAVHLSLVSLVPFMPKVPIIGIVSEMFVSVWMLLYVVGGIREQFDSTDATALTELRG